MNQNRTKRIGKRFRMADKEKEEMEKRPLWSWEAGIFANIGEIGKWIDHHAMLCESGDIASIFQWNAALKQFYRNIKSLLSLSVRETADKSFNEVEIFLQSGTDTLPGMSEEVKKVKMILGNLNEMLYQARNELLIKVTERRNVDKELRDYMIPKEAKERREENA